MGVKGGGVFVHSAVGRLQSNSNVCKRVNLGSEMTQPGGEEKVTMKLTGLKGKPVAQDFVSQLPESPGHSPVQFLSYSPHSFHDRSAIAA